MKKIILFLTIILLTFIKVDAQTNEKAINDCFIEFKKNFSEKNGVVAYTFIDTKSIDYLNTLLKEIKYGDSLAVSKLNPMDKLFLFCVRSLVDNSILKGFDSKDLFDYLINNNLFGTYNYIGIGEIDIDSNIAKAKILDTDPPSFLIFYKENDYWKYYINSVLEPEKEKLKMILAENNLNETDFVINRVEKMTDKSFNQSLWLAPLKE